MKRKSNVSLGPGAPSLILIFVVLALSMLGMLALMTGRNDLRLSSRSVQVIEAVYALNADAEQTRADLDEILAAASLNAEDDAQYMANIWAALPAEMELVGREISWIETDGYRNRHCAVEILPLNSSARSEFTRHTLVSAVSEESEDDGLVEFD